APVSTGLLGSGTETVAAPLAFRPVTLISTVSRLTSQPGALKPMATIGKVNWLLPNNVIATGETGSMLVVVMAQFEPSLGNVLASVSGATPESPNDRVAGIAVDMSTARLFMGVPAV